MRGTRLAAPAVVGVAVLVGLAVLALPAAGHYVGVIYYPPAVDDGTGALYVSGTDGILYALEPDGEPIWTYNASAELTTPAAQAGDRVVAGTVDGRVVAVDTADGTERWTARVRGASGREVVVAVAAADGAVYAVAGRTLHALSPRTGAERWTFTADGRITTAPAATDGRVYVAASRGDAGAVHALSADGDRLWARTLDGRPGPPAAGPDGTVYVEANGTLHALAADGTEGWTLRAGDVWSAPIVDGPRLVVGTRDGRLLAIEDGAVAWTYAGGGPVAPALGPGGRGVVAVTRGAVIAVQGGDLRWRTPIGATVLAPPSVGNGHVYVGTQLNRTYALAPNGSVAWIDRYATPFGAFTDVPADAAPADLLAGARGTPTRTVPKRVRPPDRSPAATAISTPGAGVVVVLVVAVLLVVLARARR